MKIKFRIEVKEKEVLFRILEQDERYRATEKNPPFWFYASNGYFVSSVQFPALTRRGVYLRGELKKFDNDTVKQRFMSEKDAMQYANNIAQALNEWNKHK